MGPLLGDGLEVAGRASRSDRAAVNAPSSSIRRRCEGEAVVTSVVR